MASITLDFINHVNDNGNFSASIIHAMVVGLNVTYTELDDINVSDGEVLVWIDITFIGPYDDLITLIRRFTSNSELQQNLIARIKE